MTRSETIAIGRMVKKIPTQGQTLRRSVDMANCMYVRVCSLYARWKCFRKGNYQYVFYIHLLSVFMYTCVFPSSGRRPGAKSPINQVITVTHHVADEYGEPSFDNSSARDGGPPEVQTVPCRNSEGLGKFAAPYNHETEGSF